MAYTSLFLHGVVHIAYGWGNENHSQVCRKVQTPCLWWRAQSRTQTPAAMIGNSVVMCLCPGHQTVIHLCATTNVTLGSRFACNVLSYYTFTWSPDDDWSPQTAISKGFHLLFAIWRSIKRSKSVENIDSLSFCHSHGNFVTILLRVRIIREKSVSASCRPSRFSLRAYQLVFSTGRIFVKFYIEKLLRIFVEKIKIPLKSDKYVGHSTWRPKWMDIAGGGMCS